MTLVYAVTDPRMGFLAMLGWVNQSVDCRLTMPWLYINQSTSVQHMPIINYFFFAQLITHLRRYGFATLMMKLHEHHW
jgi:hypothetical protein